MEIASDFLASISDRGISYARQNDGVTPVFFIDVVCDQAATEKQGRTVYCEKEVVRLHIAGDHLSVATMPVDAAVIGRFPEQYEAWKRKQSGSHIKGMPLAKWPLATPLLIKELDARNIFSVEDLAGVSDGNIQYIADGRALRDKAIAWLASAKDGAEVTRYASEASRLRDEVAELRRLLEARPAASETSRKMKNRANQSARMKIYWAKKKEAQANDASGDS